LLLIIARSRYRAPELLLGAPHHSPAVDAWSLGCLLVELLAAAPVFPGVEVPGGGFQLDQMARVARLLGPPREDLWPEVLQLPFYADFIKRTKGTLPPPVRDAEELKQRLKALFTPASNLHNNSANGEQQPPQQQQQQQQQQANPANSCAYPTAAWPTAHAYDLVLRLLCYNPARRMTLHAALSHPFFTEDLRAAPTQCIFALTVPPGIGGMMTAAAQEVRHCSYRQIYRAMNGLASAENKNA